MDQVYSLTKIFFSIKDKQIQSGKLELTSEPTTRAVSSTEDMGPPVVSFRDPKTITFIFNVEVTIGSYDYKQLTDMSQNQFYNAEESTHEKLLSLVFNDFENIHIVSNHAFFAEEPSRSYAAEAEKVTFEIRAINCKVKKTK
ncbi:DUF1463 family protein [Borrelia duttonii]|uniref:Uncharacterized conserved protein n=1 Tax=Borrelia duttonii (strain Ly) TaxID=412419 RepID=B5RNQ6_BORDL|nr:uncharacterized conserved protein [Borrelia duttonii Ly]